MSYVEASDRGTVEPTETRHVIAFLAGVVLAPFASTFAVVVLALVLLGITVALVMMAGLVVGAGVGLWVRKVG